jgi:hypothetical protein
MQFKINYKLMSPILRNTYQPYRLRLITNVTSQPVLKELSIAQLVTLLHNLLSLRENNQPL